MSYPQRVARKSNRDMLIFKRLVGKKMLALRLCSSSTGLASLFLLLSHLVLFSRRSKMIITCFSCSKKQNETKQTDKSKRTSRASKLIVPPEKGIPVYPLFRTVIFPLFHQDQTVCFLCWLAPLWLQLCDSSAGNLFLMRQTMLKFDYRVASQYRSLLGKK